VLRESIDTAFWLLHHFFDGHVREVLRVEHEAVVLIQLREAQPRLGIRKPVLRDQPSDELVARRQALEEA
jgi:hypothetical protein